VITLTKDEAQQVMNALYEVAGTNDMGGLLRARKIIRDKLSALEPEPVAWMEIEKYLDEENLWCERKVLLEYDNGRAEPLYMKDKNT